MFDGEGSEDDGDESEELYGGGDGEPVNAGDDGYDA